MNKAELSTKLFEILHDSALTWRVIDAAEARLKEREEVSQYKGNGNMKSQQKVQTLKDMFDDDPEVVAIINRAWKAAEEQDRVRSKQAREHVTVTLKQSDPIGAFMAGVGIGPHKVGKKEKRVKDPFGAILTGVRWR